MQVVQLQEGRWRAVQVLIMNRFYRTLLSYLQGKCSHPDHAVAADILEGSVERLAVKHCRVCGAVKISWSISYDRGHVEGEWRPPIPLLLDYHVKDEP